MPKLTPDGLNHPSSPTDEYLMLNAIDCWLYHFPEHKWTPLYQKLRDATVNKDEVPKRPRPAKRARKAKAPSTTQRKDTGETTTKETS